MIDDSTAIDAQHPDDEEPPWGPSMTVNGETYATSLFWQPMQDPDDPIPEVQETAETIVEGADLYCLRMGGAPQYALGLSEEGHRSGMIAAAISLADVFSDQPSSVSVFEVDEGWWFLAVRNDLILSEEDVLYLNEEDAQRAFFSMMAVPDWGRKIAPASWGIEGTQELDLSDVLVNTRQVKLQKLRGLRGTKFLVAVGAGALVALFALYKIFDMIFGGSSTVQQVKPDLAAMRSMLPKTPRVKKQEVVEKKPWDQLADPVDLMSSCYERITYFNAVRIPGWDIGNISCNLLGVTASWRRKWGRIAWAKEGFEFYKISNIVVMADGNEIVASSALKENVDYKRSEPLYFRSKLVEEINDLFQAIGQEIMLSQARDQVKVVGGLETKVEGAKHPSVEFTFVSTYDPKMWIPLISKFTALEVSNIIYAPDSNKWGYEGKIYEKTLMR